MKKLVDGLKHFQENLFWESRELFERAAQGQRPIALLITCSDSRVLPETLLQAGPGDLFVSRNAGNIVPPPEVPSGEAATIEYAIKVLGVTDLIVCGHYRCGAVKAILEPQASAKLAKTMEWLAHASETKSAIEKEHPALQGEALWDKAVERNALLQVNHLTKHSAVAEALAAGKIRLHAWVLRFETSEILSFNPLANAFCPLLEQPVVHAVVPAPENPPFASEEPVAKPNSIQVNWRGLLENLAADIPASLVVAALALPLCVAIAKASGISTAAGIIAAVIGGVVVGLLGGGPLQVSGPTSGLIVILVGIVSQRGLSAMAVIVALAGLLQCAAGLLRLGQWFRAVSPAVILGMLAGIGAVLVSQQMHVTVDDAPSPNPLLNVVNLPHAFWGMFVDHGHASHLPAALIGMLTLAVLLLWKPLVPKPLKVVPGVLMAMVIATAATAFLSLPIQRVEFDSLVSGVTFLDFASSVELLGHGQIWQLAATVALVASAETLLTAAAVDQMHTGPRTRYDRELAAQGIGNMICGALGALPVASVIVRSSANVEAGARTRLSALLHGVWLLLFALVFPGLLRMVPTAALAAILVLTGIRLIQIRAIRQLWDDSIGEGVICLATAVTVVAVDLFAGVVLGLSLSLLKLIHTFSRLRIRRRIHADGRSMTMVLEGSATFIRLPKIAQALETVPPNVTLHFDLKGLSYIDHACLALLMEWEKQHEATGGKLILDWETLRARFRRAVPRPRLKTAKGLTAEQEH